MKEKPLPRIIAITQATGWVSVFKEDDGSLTRYPVAVWAIVDDEFGDARVVGLSQSMERFIYEDDSSSNFLRWEPA